MGMCHLCNEAVDDHDLIGHCENLHGEKAERWPDGSLVIVDETLEPVDFSKEA